MTHDSTGTVAVSIDLPLEPAVAFDVLVDEMAAALTARGLRFTTGRDGGISDGATAVGAVVVWEPGARIVLAWHPADWQPDETTRIELRLEATATGTRVTIAHHGWGRLIGDAPELLAWFVDAVAAPLLRAGTPAALGDWLTDRGARRPAGARARAIYGDPLYHYPNFRVILAELALTADDVLLEVGCGGGALLRDALRSGCRAVGVDHSPAMVELAREQNRDAVASGRLEIVEADAARLPLADGTFTCAAMTGVLGFLAEPEAALAEVCRVLRPGGRFVALGSDPELRGTPAAPEPMASRLRFYGEAELARLGKAAGFASVDVVRRDLAAHARDVGIPEEHLPLFAGSGTTFLLARKA